MGLITSVISQMGTLSPSAGGATLVLCNLVARSVPVPEAEWEGAEWGEEGPQGW